MSNQALQKTDDKPMEFVPYGAQDKIKLTVSIIRNLVAVPTKSGKTCSDKEAIKFMMMCQARRLNPFEGDAYLIGYDNKDGTATFSLITAHQAFLKRAELNDQYDGMKSGIIIERDGESKDLEGDFFLEGDKLLGGWATVYFKGRSQPMHKRIRLKRFQKSWGIWQEDPAGMICKCAEADALRSSFPTMLGGLYLKEETAQVRDTVSMATPIFAPKTPPAISEGVTTPVTTSNEPPAASAEQGSPATEVRAMCAKDGIQEKHLIEFCEAIGLCNEGLSTLEQVFAANDTAADMLKENWPEFAAKIKESVS